MSKPKTTLYYFKDGPCDFHTKEEQLVDQVAVALAVPVTWFDARSYDAGPFLMTFNVSELPTLVGVRRGSGLTRTVIIEGGDLKNKNRLTRLVEKLLV